MLFASNKSDLISYWKNLKYVNLRLLAAKILPIFFSQHMSVSTFSLMKNIKSRNRSHLLDESLEAELICSVTELEPNYIKLVKDLKKVNFMFLDDFKVLIQSEILKTIIV